MDYVTRQFVNLAKKLRKELPKLAESLRKDIKQQTEAIREARNAYDQGHHTVPILRAELQVPHPIEIQTNPKDKKSSREWFKLVVETLTLLAVIWYAWEAHRQFPELQKSASAAGASAKEAQKANENTKAALIYVQRAFVFPDPSPNANVIGPTGAQSATFEIKWENSGSTPTRNMKTHLSYQWMNTPLPDNFPFPDLWGNKPHIDVDVALGPKANVLIETDPIPLTVIDQTIQHNMHLYLWGWAKYQDVFPATKEHISKFCYEFRSLDKTLIAQSTLPTTIRFRFDNCRRNNCFDEECGQY